MSELAQLYLEGNGVHKSVAEARCWYQEALEALGRQEGDKSEELEAAEFVAEGLPNCLNTVQEIEAALAEISLIQRKDEAAPPEECAFE